MTLVNLMSRHAEKRCRERSIEITPEMKAFIERLLPMFVEGAPLRFTYQGMIYVGAKKKGKAVLVTAFPVSVSPAAKSSLKKKGGR